MIGRSSDRTKERCWHVALPAVTFATVGILGALCQFWSIPPAFLGGAAAAAGGALINSVGNLARFVSP